MSARRLFSRMTKAWGREGLIRSRSLWVAGAVAAGLAGGAVDAQAGIESYGGAPPNPRNYTAYETYKGPQHSVRSNLVQNYYGIGNRVCAGAFSGSAFYGSYFCASGQACHPYGGANVLYPAAHNGENFSQHMFGIDYFGVDSYSGCPIGA